MPDITVVCPHCGAEAKVSEYASSGAVMCPTCARPLELPKRESGMKLSLNKTSRLLIEKDMPPEDVPPPPPPPPPEKKGRLGKKKQRGASRVISAAEAGHGRQQPRGMDRVHISRDKIRAPRVIWGILTFLLVGGAFIGLQYSLGEHPEFRTYYVQARLIISLLGYLVLLLTAFEDNTFQGVFCLFPPYGLYYVFVRSDSYILRGVWGALVISIVAELHFLGDGALLTVMNDWMNQVIQGGSGLIDKASEAPDYSR